MDSTSPVARFGFSVPGSAQQRDPQPEYVFAAQRMRRFASSHFPPAETRFGQTFAIAEINENYSAVIAGDIHQTAKRLA
jgi:hypothetical protein